MKSSWYAQLERFSHFTNCEEEMDLKYTKKKSHQPSLSDKLRTQSANTEIVGKSIFH